MSSIPAPAMQARNRYGRWFSGWWRAWFGWLAVAFALSGIACGAYRMHVQPKAPTVPQKSLMVEALQKKVAGKPSATELAREREYETARHAFAPLQERLDFIGQVLGLGAILLTLIGAMRRESAGLLLIAVTLGIAANFFDVALLIVLLGAVGGAVSMVAC